MERFTTGQIQTHLSLKKMKKLRIPLLSRYFEVEVIVKRFIESKTVAKRFYAQAQKLLEQELGLDKLVFEKPVGYEVTFNEVISGHRIDSQCYKPDFINYEKYLRRNSDF